MGSTKTARSKRRSGLHSPFRPLRPSMRARRTGGGILSFLPVGATLNGATALSGEIRSMCCHHFFRSWPERLTLFTSTRLLILAQISPSRLPSLRILILLKTRQFILQKNLRSLSRRRTETHSTPTLSGFTTLRSYFESF